MQTITLPWVEVYCKLLEWVVSKQLFKIAVTSKM